MTGNDKSAEEIVRALRWLAKVRTYCDAHMVNCKECEFTGFCTDPDSEESICEQAELFEQAAAKIAELNDFASSQSAKLLARVAELEGQLCTTPSETIYEQTLREYGIINIANLYECAEHREAAIRSQLTASQQETRAAVEFIRHLDREYSHYIADRGFEQWRGPQEAEKGADRET